MAKTGRIMVGFRSDDVELDVANKTWDDIKPAGKIEIRDDVTVKINEAIPIEIMNGWTNVFDIPDGMSPAEYLGGKVSQLSTKSTAFDFAIDDDAGYFVRYSQYDSVRWCDHGHYLEKGPQGGPTADWKVTSTIALNDGTAANATVQIYILVAERSAPV